MLFPWPGTKAFNPLSGNEHSTRWVDMYGKSVNMAQGMAANYICTH